MVVYRRDIDGLRAVAVLSVVLCHAHMPFFAGGFIGVDVFFVISGFLITGIITSEIGAGTFSLPSFYERRARRLLPALFFMVAASCLAGWIVFSPTEFVKFSKSIIATILFSSNIWFWRAAEGGYFADSSDFLPLLHTWSLSVEEQFYLIFPLLLLWLSSIRREFALSIILMGALSSLVMAEIFTYFSPSAGFYLAPTRAWELGLGAIVAMRPISKSTSRIQRETVSAVGLIAILIAGLAYAQPMRFPGISALLPCLGAAAILWSGGTGTTVTSRMLSFKPLVAVGTISYSLYLWHWPILSFLRLRFQTVDLTPAWSWIAIILSIGIAAASWLLVERPFRNRAFLKRTTVFSLSACAMLASIAVALTVVLAGGFPHRLSPEAILLASSAADANPRRDECFGLHPREGLCRIGNTSPGPIDFILWGDSHADAIFPGVDLAAQVKGQRGLFVGTSSCPPLLGVGRQPPYEGCRTFNDEVVQALKERKDIRTVILFSRWAVYQTGAHTGGDVAGRTIITDEGSKQAGSESNAVAFDNGIRRTVETLVETGRTVIIIGGTPEIGWNVPRAMYVNARWHDPLPLAPTSTSVAVRNAGVDAAFARVESRPKVIVVNIRPLFCRWECITEFKGHPVYYDDDHLSAFAAKGLVAPFLAEVLFSD